MAIREYRDLKPTDMSLVTLLAERKIINHSGVESTWCLKHHTAGFECAGSCARETSEKWSVTSESCGSVFGNSFSKQDEAKTVFDSEKPWYRPNPIKVSAENATALDERHEKDGNYFV